MSDVTSKLKRLRTYVEGVQVEDLEEVDPILSHILGGLDDALDALEGTGWTPTTWSKVAEGDEVLGADDQVWTCQSSKPVPDGRLHVSIERGTDRFHFYPAPSQPVKARRGPTGKALEMLASTFTVEVISNGRAAA